MIRYIEAIDPARALFLWARAGSSASVGQGWNPLFLRGMARPL